MRVSLSRQTALLLFIVLLVISALGATQLGAMKLSLREIWSEPFDSIVWQVWLTIRVPRVLLALLIGAALAVSGTIMQGLFRNPLADPGLLGISSGAGLMVALALLLPLQLPLFASLWLPVIAAFIGSLLVTLLIFQLNKVSQGQLSRLLLLGIAINALSGSLIGVLSWLSNDQQLRQLSLWGMGSLAQAQWSVVGLCAVIIIPTSLLLLRSARALNLLQLGEEDAFYSGLDVLRTQQYLLIGNALLVGTAVSFTGIIGFIGLVIPHLVRMVFGSDHRWLLPGSIIVGGLLLLVSDTLARTLVQPAEMPVGLLTSLLGAPWFFILILKRLKASYV